MKLSHALKLIAPLSLAIGSAAFAQSSVRLGTPNYNGTGCPMGKVSASITPDGQSLSILFSSFEVAAGGNTGKISDRKACNIAIPVHVPQGLSVSIVKMDYRGYQHLPVNSSAVFDVEYFFAGQNGPAYRKNFYGAADGNFTLSNDIYAAANVWSACGADVNLRTNASIAVQTNSYYEQANMTLDSVDVNAGVVYQLSWKTCGAGPSQPQQPQYPQPNQPQQPQYPQQPQQPNYPQPQQPQYPQPQQPQYPSLGPCMVSQVIDSRGLASFLVRDGYGSNVATISQYAEAIRIAQQYQQMGRCSGVVTQNQPNQGGYPQQQQPSSNNNYNSCQIMEGRNAYGQILFRVMDRSGRILLSTTSQREAYQTQQRDSRCFQ